MLLHIPGWAMELSMARLSTGNKETLLIAARLPRRLGGAGVINLFYLLRLDGVPGPSVSEGGMGFDHTPGA